MEMIYNSDAFTVLRHEAAGMDGLPKGGFEIVDKFSRKDIFIDDLLAEEFRRGAQNLMNSSPSMEEIDDYIGRFTSMMQMPLVAH